jgi:CBS domain containing-hemolysin-like protein
MNDTSCSSQPREGGARTNHSPFKSLRHWLRGLLKAKENEEDTVRAALEELIEERVDEGEAIQPNERVLFSNILNLRNLTVHDVMVPRADIVAIDIGTSLEDLVKLMSEEAHSRVPVYRGTLDDVAGMVHIKDVLAWTAPKRSFNLSRILRQVLFVAPSMRVLDLLLEMRLTRIHMALVVDEFGGIDGLVTIEDLVEEIVGEIQDEHDTAEVPVLIERPDGSLDASARTTIAAFEERVGPVLTDAERDEDIDTLGGLVFAVAGRVPSRGEVVAHSSGVEFEVLEADPRRIRKIRIRNLPAAPALSGTEPK